MTGYSENTEIIQFSKSQLPISNKNPAGVLLIAPHGSYRIAPFLKAAEALDIPITLVTDGPKLPLPYFSSGLHLDFSRDPSAIDMLCSQVDSMNICSVVATDDATLEIAATVAEKNGISHNSVESARISRRKDYARECQRANGLPTPWFLRLDLALPLSAQIQAVKYPCVVKPISMSASRGVIRVDNRVELVTAIRRIEKFVNAKADGSGARYLLLESFISGIEIAVEGLMSDGDLQILTVFDKPDVSQGPYFEETIYVAPTRLSDEAILSVTAQIQQVCKVYGLRQGPIHAECRINEKGIWILEIGARTIGGLCARLFRDLIGIGLEELVLIHAAQGRIQPANSDQSVGVMMIPVPGSGVLRRVEGLKAAQQLPHIVEIVIDARDGDVLIPWPEGSTYPGFIFSKADSPKLVEESLRAAHGHLRFVTAPVIPVVSV